MKQKTISHPSFVHCIGENLLTKIETSHDPDRVDHVWITMETTAQASMLLSVNTLSSRNKAAGFDGRIQIGVVKDNYQHPPRMVFEECRSFDYAEIERAHDVSYQYYERPEMESFLLSRCEKALYLEVWGVTYLRRHLGIHQIHCRWASCAVSEHITGKDGALRFYYLNGERELVLFKFCGQ